MTVLEPDERRDFGQASGAQIKPASEMIAPLLTRDQKKPLISQGLKTGAGEEGRTPDLMLGKHTL